MTNKSSDKLFILKKMNCLLHISYFKRIILLIFFFFFSTSNALIPSSFNSQKATGADVTAILNLPVQNRQIILKSRISEMFDSLKQIIFDSNQSMSIRWRAVTALRFASPLKSEPLLIKLFEDKSWYMRNAALLTLKAVNHKQADRYACRSLNDPALAVRAAAAEILIELKTSTCHDQLWKQVWSPQNFRKQQSLWIRETIISGLAKHPQQRDQQQWMKVLREEKSEPLRRLAASSLSRIN